MRPYLKKKKKKKRFTKKRAAGMTQGVDPEFSSNHSTTKK
jgi:hypothetical protein